MAYVLFGCTTADLALTAGGVIAPGAGPFSVFTTGPDRASSVAVTDLKDLAGAAVSQVTADADGYVRFQAQDSHRVLWIDMGVGLRVAMRPVDLVGPKGDKGDTGDTGDKGDTGDTGDTGPVGPAPVITIGTVTTLAPGAAVTVTLTETTPGHYRLDAGIPQGATGGATLGGVLTTKGDVAVGQGAGVATRQPAGADGTVVAYDSTTATGLAAVHPGNVLTPNQATGTDALGNTTGFNNPFQCTIASSTVRALVGSRSLELTATGASPGFYTPLGAAGVAVTPGQTYTALAAAWITAVAGSSILTIRWYNGATNIGEVTSAFNSVRGAWVQHVLAAVAPATATHAAISPRGSGMAAGETIHWDRLAFHVGAGGLWTPPGVPVPNLGIRANPDNSAQVQVWNPGNNTWVTV